MSSPKESRLQIEANGRIAYGRGATEFDCPYPAKEKDSDERRTWWFNGWLSERTRDRLGHIFARYPDQKELV